MNNHDKREALRQGYKQILMIVPHWITEGLGSSNPAVQSVAEDVVERQKSALQAIIDLGDVEEIDTCFIDELICRYNGKDTFVLDDDLINNSKANTVQIVSDYLDQMEENLREFYDEDFSISTDSVNTAMFYEGVFGNRADGVIGARLNCIGSLMVEVKKCLRDGLSPASATISIAEAQAPDI